MIERNECSYHINYKNNAYILKTSLLQNKLKLACKDANSQIYDGEFTLNDLMNISKYFQKNYTIEQIQGYLNGIIEKQRIGIVQSGNALSLILYLVNNDRINIPLLIKSNNNIYNNYDNYQNYNIPQNIPISNQYNKIPQKNNAISGQISNQYIITNAVNQYPKNILPHNINNPQYLSPSQKQFLTNEDNSTEQGKAKINTNQISSNANPPIMKSNSSNINYSYRFNPNSTQQLEDDSSILRPIREGQEQLKNEMKRLLDEASRLKEENQVYKTQHESLIKENSILKNENNNYKKQIITFQNENKGLQDENNSLRNQIDLLNKDLEAIDNQNNEIRKMYEDLQNENKGLPEENNSLRNQIALLNKDVEALDNQNNEIRKMYEDLQNENNGLPEENNSLRNQIALLNKDVEALDNQNNEIRKMYQDLQNENNLYKNQVDELNKDNEILRGQIDELNNNFTLINNELESIKMENIEFKNNIEQQNNNSNQELINKLIEENNIYKQKAEENEILKKQIQELQYHLQMGQEKPMEQREDEQDQGNEIKGDIIHDIKELEMITKKINNDEDKKIIINLLYKASVDGDKAAVFHEKCDQAQNSIVLVETKNGKRFGGFTTCSWSGNCVDKDDPNAFIFSFDKMKTYDNIPGDEAIGCYPKFGPIFLGCQIKIFDNFFTKGGTTFEKELNFNTQEDYELTGGDRNFEVKDIEVYEVIIE